MREKRYALTSVGGLSAAFSDYSNQQTPKQGVDGIHCPRCAGYRRVNIEKTEQVEWKHSGQSFGGGSYIPPSIFRVSCRQCGAGALAVMFESPTGPDVAMLWNVGGGLASPHTPTAVGYYLDQAARCESVGARTAAVVMYRAALEHILLEQGYTERMLGPKLDKVKAEIKAGTAKSWARDLAPAFMDVFRKLGNASVHADDGDTSRQAAIDAELLADLHVAMEQLLDLVYERPQKEATRLARLEASAAKLKK